MLAFPEPPPKIIRKTQEGWARSFTERDCPSWGNSSPENPELSLMVWLTRSCHCENHILRAILGEHGMNFGGRWWGRGTNAVKNFLGWYRKGRLIFLYDALVRFSIFHQWDCLIKENKHKCVAPFAKDQEKNYNFTYLCFFLCSFLF